MAQSCQEVNERNVELSGKENDKRHQVEQKYTHIPTKGNLKTTVKHLLIEGNGSSFLTAID
jgi:hypothetical protein